MQGAVRKDAALAVGKPSEGEVATSVHFGDRA
jgi:hypothetical protein